MIDKSKLKELAQKATPGEWLHTDRTVYALQHAGWRKGVEQFENRFYCGIQHGRGTPEIELEANAAYIAAANPAAILELLAELETLEKLRRLCDGGKFDLTDSPKSFVSAVTELLGATNTEPTNQAHVMPPFAAPAGNA